MPKSKMLVGLAGALLALSGCGGSSSNSTSGQTGGAPMSEFEAVLPDGSPMEIEVMTNADGIWSGSYAVAATTGDYAFEAGSFEGTISGNQVSATCNTSDGKEFTLTGAVDGNKSLKLIRSDIPGTTLSFSPVTPDAVPAGSPRGQYSFFLDGGGTTGRVTIDSTPFASHSGGTLIEYRGTWNGMEVTLWAYSNGLSMVLIRIDPLCLQTSYFSNYPVTAFATKTVTSGTGQMTMYNSTLRTQIKFKTIATASP